MIARATSGRGRGSRWGRAVVVASSLPVAGAWSGAWHNARPDLRVARQSGRQRDRRVRVDRVRRSRFGGRIRARRRALRRPVFPARHPTACSVGNGGAPARFVVVDNDGGRPSSRTCPQHELPEIRDSVRPHRSRSILVGGCPGAHGVTADRVAGLRMSRSSSPTARPRPGWCSWSDVDRSAAPASSTVVSGRAVATRCRLIGRSGDGAPNIVQDCRSRSSARALGPGPGRISGAVARVRSRSRRRRSARRPSCSSSRRSPRRPRRRPDRRLPGRVGCCSSRSDGARGDAADEAAARRRSGSRCLFAVATPSHQSGDVNSLCHVTGASSPCTTTNPFRVRTRCTSRATPMRRYVGQLWQRTPRHLRPSVFTVVMAALAPVIGTSSFMVHFSYQLIALGRDRASCCGCCGSGPATLRCWPSSGLHPSPRDSVSVKRRTSRML